MSDDIPWDATRAYDHPIQYLPPAEGYEPRLTVAKWESPAPLSFEQLIAGGYLTEEQAIAQGWEPPPPTPRLRRWRWALESWWYDHRPHSTRDTRTSDPGS